MHPWIFALWLCSAGAPPDPWITVERVVAIVDDDLVLASELERRVTQARDALRQLKDPAERERRAATVERETLQTIVEEHLVAQAAARLGLTIEDTQIDAAVAQIRDANGLDDAGLARAVGERGRTIAEYRLELQRELLRFRLISLLYSDSFKISDEAVRAAYEAEKAKNPALSDLAGASEHLRTVLFERAMADAFARWLTEARRTAHVELRL
jgi:peptidyl-prolyl cis-trans isomerase SurA